MATLAAAESLDLRPFDRARARRLAALLGVGAQIALALLVIRAFRLESRTFFLVALLAGAAAVPHALLPLAWRLPAFAALSTVALAIALGPTDALWVGAVGTALVGLCHLPISTRARGALLVAAAIALAVARAEYVEAPWSTAAWVVLGSMFMFRLALYFHAIRHEPERPTAAQAAAYFLMLPNPVFPLFPVVDFTTFVRSHYAEGTDPIATYQTGIAWIARGLTHLLLYRIVYHNLPPDPLDLGSLGGLAWYLIGTFLLYLRVSGQFHVIVGLLRLYGFALPETHRLFFLSSSFTDFWRRINIYWKDFMMKLVYYPSFFRLRRFGGTVALVGSTIVVFASTWLLHSYQWFWILGDFLLTLPDMLFWGLLGALVVVTALREAKRGRDRSLGARRWSARLAWRVVATFCALCVLWSLWSAESVVEWVWMWRAGAHVGVGDVALLAALLAAGVAVAGRNWSAPRLSNAGAPPWWRRLDVRTAATLVALLVLAQPPVARGAGPAEPLLAAARLTTLNARDAANERRGYYERLDRAPRLGAQGWEVRSRRPADWLTIPQTAAYHPRGDFRIYDLRPNTRVRYLGQPMTTNAFGMRDAPRTLAKPPGTVRIAFLGPSLVMGTGVGDGAAFPAQLERRLNAVVAPRTGLRYEALNFGAPAYSVLQELATFEESAAPFSPDVVVLTTPARHADRTAGHLIQVVEGSLPIPYPGLDSLLRAWHVSSRLPYRELHGMLRIAAPSIHAWTLRQLAIECRRRGIVPVLLTIDNVGTPPDRDHALLRTAADAGYVVIDLFDVYGPAEGFARLQVAEWDPHPNATAHALIADSLLVQLRRHPELLGARRADRLTASTSPGDRR